MQGFLAVGKGTALTHSLFLQRGERRGPLLLVVATTNRLTVERHEATVRPPHLPSP